MSAGPLVVTYNLSERSREIVAEELQGAAPIIYLADLAPEHRAAALRSGGVCGIIGFGNGGGATARLMRAFGMKIHAINRRGASDEPTDWIATPDRLDELLRASDVFVVCAALTTATEGLIGARELSLMQ